MRALVWRHTHTHSHTKDPHRMRLLPPSAHRGTDPVGRRSDERTGAVVSISSESVATLTRNFVTVESTLCVLITRRLRRLTDVTASSTGGHVTHAPVYAYTRTRTSRHVVSTTNLVISDNSATKSPAGICCSNETSAYSVHVILIRYCICNKYVEIVSMIHTYQTSRSIAEGSSRSRQTAMSMR